MEEIKVLLVEDDPSLGFVVKDNLTELGYNIKWCKDGNDAFTSFFQDKFDICLLDVMLPKRDGFSLAKEIRIVNREVPILFLTAKSQIDDKIEGFKAGGDDYLTKPFAIEELHARIQAILKRTKSKKMYQQPEKKEIFEIGNYTFNYKNLELTCDDFSKVLTRLEADLLRLLCIHKNQVLEREIALNIVWGKDDYFLGRSMDVFITKLRKYLKEDARIQIINVHGVGFKLILD
jgi:DNA-binding response OmpR family regulator